MTRSRAARLLLALAAGWALWAALSLLDLLPFTLELGDWTTLRFFGLNALGGLLWAGQSALWWWAGLLAAEGLLTRQVVLSIAAVHTALAILTVAGNATIQAVLPGLLLALGAVLVTRGMARERAGVAGASGK